MEIKLKSSDLVFKVDKKKLFQNLLDFNWGSAITEIIDIESSNEASAFALLYTASHKTNVELAIELGQTEINNAENLVQIYGQLEKDFKEFLESEIVLTKDFFEKITQYSPVYLIKAFNFFEKYLEKLNIPIPTNIRYKYYSDFRLNLLEEYTSNSEKYKRLVEFFNNPVSESNDAFSRLISHYQEISAHYTSRLQAEVEESIETLKDLYIEPFFQVHSKNIKREANYDFVSLKKKINIHTALNEFLLEDKLPDGLREDYNMIFIIGQPGQGKTSLCYKLVYDILKKTNGLPNSPLFFIKIRDLHANDFVRDTFNVIQKAIQQEINFGTDKCILVLDGLDEAYMSGGLTDLDLKNLYERLNKTAKNNKKLKIILTSRLNYLDEDDPSVEGSLVLKIDVLTEGQIHKYLTRFSDFYPDNNLFDKIEEILSNKNFTHIKELMQQPVLIYFIALTNINIEEHDSKSKIYNKIFDALARRSWDNNGQLNYIKSEYKNDYTKYSKRLRTYIRSLAFEIYQSPNLHITVSTLSDLDATKEFIDKCFDESIAKGTDAVKKISKYLLVSFYFQASSKNENGDAAIEFFHNSLWEYLTAEYMWEENKRLILQKDEDDDLVPVRMNEYFEMLNKLVGNKEFNREIRKNLENIVLTEHVEIQERLYAQTHDVFFKLLKHEMLLTYDWQKEELTPKEKMLALFCLAWTLFYWNNQNLNRVILGIEQLNEFFFDFRSQFSYQYTIRNIEFVDSYSNEFYVTRCILENVHFNFLGGGETLNFYSNEIENSIFNSVMDMRRVIENKFRNVEFREVEFDNSTFTGNTLENVKMFDCGIPSKEWLDEMLRDNSADDDFISNHEVKSEISGSGNEIFYITYKSENYDLS